MRPAASVIGSARFDKLNVKIYEDAEALGRAAAADFSQSLERRATTGNDLAVIFATGISQVQTLLALTSMKHLPWRSITGFHMDEYVSISNQHAASFQRYLRERLTEHVPFRQFYFIDGAAADPQQTCRDYAALLRAYSPQLCLLGIGENGHLAFNDPQEADFNDPEDVKVVTLDRTCREQQVHEGWFSSIEDVPGRAITLTIPRLMRTPELIVSVPGKRKARIVWRTLYEPMSPNCPATILRHHPHATVYLDRESAAELNITPDRE